MKAPKYADGGKTAKKRLSPKEWNDLNKSKGYLISPISNQNPDGYNEFYDPSIHSPVKVGQTFAWTKPSDPNWKYTSEADSPWIKYTPPIEVQKTAIVKPMVDPNRKPLVFGSGSTYDPNTGKYYNPTNPSQEIKPQILQYKKGGVVSKIKKYADGGVTTYDNDGNPLDESGNPIVADNMQSRDTSSALNQDNEAKMNSTISDANTSINNTSVTENTPKTPKAPKFDKNAAFGAGAGLITGVGAGLAANQSVKIDAKGKDNRGRYTSKDAAVKGTSLKGVSLGSTIGGTVGTAFGPLGTLVGAGAGAAVGAGVGALVGVSKGKKDLSSIDSSNKKMDAEIAIANQQSRQQQAILNRNNNILDATLVNPYSKQNASFDNEDNLIRAFNKGGVVGKVKQMCANGGTIKGEGGPKEDKINAKIKPGSFVVPAKNAEAAEELREKILMKSPIPKASLNQSGGAKVKLSNGEHLFTPEEKEELLEKGIDVNLLAPNAEKKEEKMENKDYFMVPKLVGLADGGLVKGAKVDNVTWDGKNWVSPNGSKYTAEKGKIFTDKYNQLIAKEKSSKEQQKATEISIYSRKLKEAADSGNTNEANKLQAKINELSGVKQSTSTGIKSTKVNAPKPSNSKVTSPKLTASSFAKQSMDNAIAAENSGLNDVIVPVNDVNASVSNVDNSLANSAYAADTRNNVALNTPPTTQPNKLSGIASKIGKGISNVDPTAFLGIGQGVLGYNMLKGQVRPVDKAVIDPTYNEVVNRSINDARFGLTPEQQAIANNDIEAARRDAAYAGLVTSGGSGVQAYNTAQNAASQAWKAKLGLKVADQDLRMQKQQYADAQVANRANILAGNRRQAFNDAMGTFQQKQQAGSELIGAGLANTIGAYRFNQEMKNRNAADLEREAWTRNIGNS